MSRQSVIGFFDVGDENDFLSNWYMSPFELGGNSFCCMEQYMMYRKAAMFHDEMAMAAILASNDPAEIKQLGRGVKNFDGRIWKGRCQLVVFTGLMAKFTQNEVLRGQLLATGDTLLAECSPTDGRWGIRIPLTDERRFDPDQWKGDNLLGFALMEVREQIR